MKFSFACLILFSLFPTFAYAQTIKKKLEIETSFYEKVSSKKKADTTIIDASTDNTITIQGSGGNGLELWVDFTTNLIYKKDKVEATFVTNRIKQKSGSINIDTDEPFANDVISTMAIQHYNGLLERPETINLTEQKGNLSKVKIENKRDFLWLSSLPNLHNVPELSGLVLNKATHSTAWTDSLYTPTHLFVNTYEVQEAHGKISVVFLKGEATNVGNESFKEFDISQLKNGGTIEEKTIIDTMTYKGYLEIETSSNFIRKVNLEVELFGRVSMMGQILPKQTNSTVEFSNKAR